MSFYTNNQQLLAVLGPLLGIEHLAIRRLTLDMRFDCLPMVTIEHYVDGVQGECAGGAVRQAFALEPLDTFPTQ